MPFSYEDMWDALLEEYSLAMSKIQYLLDNYVDLPEGTFTFPDGDTWRKTKSDEKE